MLCFHISFKKDMCTCSCIKYLERTESSPQNWFNQTIVTKQNSRESLLLTFFKALNSFKVLKQQHKFFYSTKPSKTISGVLWN